MLKRRERRVLRRSPLPPGLYHLSHVKYWVQVVLARTVTDSEAREALTVMNERVKSWGERP